MSVAVRAVGAPIERIEGREKVTGEAVYAFEHAPEGVAYAAIVTSSVARGMVRRIDAEPALSLPGVLGVLSAENAPSLPGAEGELAVLQSPAIAYRGEIVAAVVAETLEAARHAAELVRVDEDAAPHDVVLRPDHPGLYRPDKVNPNYPTDTEDGDVDAALAGAAVRVDETYSTPTEHNNPMEPHATVAVWEGDGLTLYDSNQGAGTWSGPSRRRSRSTRSACTSSPRTSAAGSGRRGRRGRMSSWPRCVLARLGRPVKLAVTRQQMFTLTGYRTPTIQRMRLGADRDGRLAAIVHDVAEQTSTVQEFAEQTALPTRMMYASPTRRTTHRLVALDVPTPSWMRAPGECPGMFALESAMDELAVACGLDPIELRIRNEPEIDPETGNPFSTRNLVQCLRQGAERFGWDGRGEPGARRDGRWLVGTGVASSTYPARRVGSTAHGRAEADGTFTIRITASDIGTGARTALTQIAADALEVPLERVRVRDRRQRVRPGDDRRRLDGNRVLGRGGRQGVRAPAGGRDRGACRHRRRRRIRARASPSTRSAPSSSRCGSIRRPARCASRGRSACSRAGGSSTRARPGRSSSAA